MSLGSLPQSEGLKEITIKVGNQVESKTFKIKFEIKKGIEEIKIMPIVLPKIEARPYVITELVKIEGPICEIKIPDPIVVKSEAYRSDLRVLAEIKMPHSVQLGQGSKAQAEITQNRYNRQLKTTKFTGVTGDLCNRVILN